ncbi:oligosaccharide flippase family protein [Bradyrhizobium sp. AZCC 2230]|uniref:oligosaccharide flippase family protein n=1 Tax=Bradyrhizobium sp. AZCC 2230 TaxID=3117021 RepID=UPI002FF40E97
MKMHPPILSSPQTSQDLRSLRQRALNAGVWSFAGFSFSYTFRFGSNLLMTRLLLPEMFGLMAMAMMVLIGLALFSDLGIKQGVVQNKRGGEPAFLNTAWSVQILRGIVLCVCACVASFLLGLCSWLEVLPKGSVYADPLLPYLISVLSLSMVISGFESTKSIQASRDLLLAKVTRIEIVSQLIGFLVMLSWALARREVWALVVGTLASVASRTILTHVWLPGVSNRLHWDQSAYRELFRFGKWLFFSSVLFFAASSGDRILLGGLVNPAVLGSYSIAFLFFSSIDQLLNKLIVDVTYPALSEVARERREELGSAYYKFHSIVAAMSYFISGLLMLSGATIVSTLYDSRYLQAGWMLEILAAAILSFPFRVVTQTFLALGLAHTFFYLNVVRVVALFIALPIGFRFWEVEGAIWGVVLSYFSSLPLILYYAVPLRLLKLRKELLILPMLPLGMLFGELINRIVLLVRF